MPGLPGGAFTTPAGACDSRFHAFEPGYPHVVNIQYTFPDGTIGQCAAIATLLAALKRRLGGRCAGVIQVTEDVTDAERHRRWHPARYPVAACGRNLLV